MLGCINAKQTKRAYGSRTDAYAMFAKTPKNGNPPDGWDPRLVSAGEPSTTTRLAAAHPQE